MSANDPKRIFLGFVREAELRGEFLERLTYDRAKKFHGESSAFMWFHDLDVRFEV